MRSIVLLNAKGGCGKTTLTTNLAGYYASRGKSVLIADFDPQGSSIDWLAARPADRPPIEGVKAWREPVRATQRPDYFLIDAPARVAGRELSHLVRHAEAVVVPVLPSPIDIRAATHFIRELLLTCHALRHEGRLAVVANRVREQNLIYQDLERFLKSLEIPFVATFRETQNYIRAVQQGLGIFELPGGQAAHDVEQWRPLLEWLEGRGEVKLLERETASEMARA